MQSIQPQTYMVNYPHGKLPLVVDTDGSRWLALNLFAESLGLTMRKDILPKVEVSPRNWKMQVVGGKHCLPADKANEFIGKLWVYPAQAEAAKWLGRHATQTLRGFTIPEHQAPMLEAEPEPVPCPVVRKFPPTVPIPSPLESGLGDGIAMMMGGRPVTSTVAIARGTDNDHASVIKLVRAYASQLERFGPIGFEIQLANTQQGGGRPVEYAYLNEPQSTLLITFMRNNPVVVDFKVRLVEAFTALVNRATDPVQSLMTMDRTSMLRMALGLSEERDALKVTNQEQQATIATLAPKAAFHDAVQDSSSNLSVSAFAKILGTGQRRLFDWLRDEKILMDNNLPYQDHIDAARFVVIENVIPTNNHGNLLKPQTLITGKGQTYIQRRWEAAKLGGVTA